MEDEQNILETQLILGKQVLEIVLDLLKDDSKIGVVLPLNINDREFTITVEKEVIDREYGVFVVTKDVYDKVKVGDEVLL